MSQANHIKQARGKLLMVWYGEDDAIKVGEGVCYNTDYGTAADADASRCNRVERPRKANSPAFAGVSKASHKAVTGGQFIEIFEPGSKSVPVAVSINTTINTGLLTFGVAGVYNKGVTEGLATEAGRFYTGKFRGRGSAIPRQTLSPILESDYVGAWSLDTDGITLTVTSTTGLAAGDTVVLLGGEDDATGEIVPGKYEISSITSATVLVLTASAGIGAGALTCTGYAYTGAATVLCDLLDGEESGGIEFLALPNAGGDTHPYMVGGVTYVLGGLTIAADAEVEFAQGAVPGDKKAFILLGTLTTSDFVVDLVTGGVQLDHNDTGSVVLALAEVNAIDAAGDGCYLIFHGALWHLRDLVGGATAA